MKSCVVIDLDSSIIHTFGNADNYKFVDFEANTRYKHKIFSIRADSVMRWGTIRPGTKEFLNSCYANFDCVVVWSAGTYDYVYKIVEDVFPVRPDVIWTRQDCVETLCDFEGVVFDERFEDENKSTKVLQKPLEKLWTSYPDINPKKTVMVDDYIDVCLQNSLYHIHITAWDKAFESLNQCDPVLIRLAKWLPTLKTYDDYKFASPKTVIYPCKAY